MRYVTCRAALAELGEEDLAVPEVTRFANFPLFTIAFLRAPDELLYP